VFERIVKFEPSYDRRHPDPARDYGIRDVLVRFVLKGPEGAVQLLFSTGWFLPHLRKELRRRGFFGEFSYPMAYDLGYHSPRPISGGEVRFDGCEILGGVCYYDGSGLRAVPLVEMLVAEGEEVVWRELEKFYRETFGGGDRPEG